MEPSVDPATDRRRWGGNKWKELRQAVVNIVVYVVVLNLYIHYLPQIIAGQTPEVRTVVSVSEGDEPIPAPGRPGR